MRSQSFSDAPRNGSYLPSFASLDSLSHTAAVPWSPIYETETDLRRRYSSDAPSSDIISRLGLGYFQSAKQHQARQAQLANSVPTLSQMMRGSRSLDANLFPSTAAQLQGYVVERGHSLPTSLPQMPPGFH